MSAALREQPISFQSAGLCLSGMLGIPETPPSDLGVVLIHGWSGTRIGPHRMLVHTAKTLLDRGITTLRFDLRGRGDSEGEADLTDLDNMIADTACAVNILKEQPHVKRIAFIGLCSGANVAMGAASLNADISALALWSALPFQPEQQTTQRRRRKWHYLKQYARKALNWRTWVRMVRGEVNVGMVGKAIGGDSAPQAGERNLKDSDRDIMSALAAYRSPMLYLTGSLDPEGLAGREVYEPFAKANKLNATFELINGANHSYYDGVHARQVIDLTAEWLLQT
jgi:pimeloyl-ACP methyl ester carboxylesterase